MAHTERFYDPLGSLSFIPAVCFALLLNPAPSTFNYLLAGLVIVWAARLGSFLFLRIADVGEDRRFRRIKQSFWRFMLIWTLQGVWVSLTSSAALVAILTDMPGAVPALAWVGIGVWLLGFATEAVADAQKSAFRKDSSRQGQFIHGLWSVCRHPNYLGNHPVVWRVVGSITGPGGLAACCAAVTGFCSAVTDPHQRYPDPGQPRSVPVG